MKTTIRFRLRSEGDGWWSCELEMPGPVPGLAATGKAQDKRDAVRKAAALAKSALKNPALRAVLPPGTEAAVDAISVVARSPEAAAAVKAAKSIGKGLKSLASKLW